MTHPIHTIATAPAASAQPLAQAEKAFGMIPNMLGTMASAPALLKSYLALGTVFDETSFTPSERQVVMMTTSFENGCAYCIGAHTVISAAQGVPDDVVNAIRDGKPLADAKLEALRR